MSIRIATSLRGQMRALAGQGIFAMDCYDQLRALLDKHLSERHSTLLAEPQHDADGRSVDWYAQSQSGSTPTVTAFKDLPEAEAQALRTEAGLLGRDIAALADRLASDSQSATAAQSGQVGQAAQSGQALSAILLRLALQHPDDNDLWSVDGRPVLINWGFAPGMVGAQPQDLSRLGSTPPPPQAQSSVPSVPVLLPHRGCLAWLLPLLLLLLLLWLALAAFGLVPTPLPTGCIKTDVTALETQKKRADVLDDELSRLMRQLEERALLCKPPVKPAPPAPEVKAPEPEVVEPFLAESQPEPKKPVEKPKPKPKPEPEPEPKPEPKQPRKNDALNIPDDAAKKNDLAFLEGCWTSETGLFSHPSREPIIAEYCFDKNGKGRRIVRERNGQNCSGGAQARFKGNRLEFDADPARCPRGGTYVPQKVDCTGSENSTQCKGNELGGSRNKWDARFKRK